MLPENFSKIIVKIAYFSVTVHADRLGRLDPLTPNRQGQWRTILLLIAKQVDNTEPNVVGLHCQSRSEQPILKHKQASRTVY